MSLHALIFVPLIVPIQCLSQVVLGGSGAPRTTFSLSSVEVFPRPPCNSCFIPDLPQSRERHTVSLLSGDTLVICGGVANPSVPPHTVPETCISWKPGNTSWTHFHTMSAKRYLHVAWTPPSHPNSIVLLGGGISTNNETTLTAEIVPGGGSFSLLHSGYEACGIPDGETIVMTGRLGHNHVTGYNINGFVRELPRLPEQRWRHACAGLPSSARASIVGGRIRLTGGRDGEGSFRSEVLEYSPAPLNQWTNVGKLEAERAYHGVLSIDPQLLRCMEETVTTTFPDQEQTTKASSAGGSVVPFAGSVALILIYM